METGRRINKILLDTQQLAGHPEDADEALLRGAFADHHTATPGVIQAYDQAEQTADVQPAVRRLLLPDGRMVTLPMCVHVPVYFPGGAVTFEVRAGSDALLVIAERAIDGWWAKGGVQDPTELRQFDLSDSFAFVGFNSRPNLITAVHPSASEVRLRDGSNRVSVRDDGTVHVGSAAVESAFAFLVNGVVVAQGIEPYTKMTYGMLGAASRNVMVKL